ncbi:MAG: hypothetical protein KJ011_03270 [Burkholderiaceae bacterium]|nr:hypothetical protein [Burkholderiaceae bacterium]
MATYVAIREAFIGDRRVGVGDSIESSIDPGDAFVLASQYKPFAQEIAQRPKGDGFVVRGPGGKLIPQATATYLANRSPDELRY